jgi:hypothetical protein
MKAFMTKTRVTRAMLVACRCNDGVCSCSPASGDDPITISFSASALDSSATSKGNNMTTNTKVPLSPIQAAAQSDDHAALFKSVVASARALRLDDIDFDKPIDAAELQAKLAKSSNITHRIALKRALSLMGCLP